ncbi:LysR family transcriptional regulator [Psychroflexus salis]|uniref:Transcriptional regulator n=1 Tax=Psychroflexus salis TaxID=1526574 RepID=A0A916ZNS0_9FLAO|nr:LysR family transcriptional regulator [Psychroflexus salis]GGE06559.1 transcriptional regulator [Psychroflexus salis]
MNYTLHQLRVFLKISESQSITKTSEELHLSQPAVSIQLKNFQEQFSIALTEQIGRKIYITDFGREIATSARNILEKVEEINYKTNAYKGYLTGKLTLSIASTAKYVMPYFLTEFMQTYQAIDLVIDVTNKTKVIRSLEKNEVDFSMVSVLPDKLKVNTLELLQNQLFLVGSSLTGHDLNNINSLDDLPFIYREEGSATRKAMEDFLISNKISIDKKIELTSNEAVKQAVIAGLGFSIMPLIGIKNELKNKDLQIIPCKGLPITTKWQLVWLASKNLSPAAQVFLNFIETHKNEIVKNHFSWIKDDFS